MRECELLFLDKVISSVGISLSFSGRKIIWKGPNPLINELSLFISSFGWKGKGELILIGPGYRTSRGRWNLLRNGLSNFQNLLGSIPWLLAVVDDTICDTIQNGFLGVASTLGQLSWQRGYECEEGSFMYTRLYREMTQYTWLYHTLCLIRQVPEGKYHLIPWITASVHFTSRKLSWGGVFLQVHEEWTSWLLASEHCVFAL